MFKDLGGLGPTVQVRQADENVRSVAESDVILLWCVPTLFGHISEEAEEIVGRSCKPQLAESLLLVPGMSEALEGKLLISILAGTTISMMREWVPETCTVVRSMPNTPTKVRNIPAAVRCETPS